LTSIIAPALLTGSLLPVAGIAAEEAAAPVVGASARPAATATRADKRAVRRAVVVAFETSKAEPLIG
jgi:hypothetical protein